MRIRNECLRAARERGRWDHLFAEKKLLEKEKNKPKIHSALSGSGP